MKINIQKLAKISKIKIDKKKEQNYLNQLTTIIEAFEKIRKLDIDNLKPFFNLTDELKNSKLIKNFKNDMSSKEILKMSNRKVENFIYVPKII